MASLELTIGERDLEAIAQRVVDKLSAAGVNPTADQAAGAAKLLWTEPEAAEALGISALSLKKYRNRGYVKSHTTTKPILYRWSDIEAIASWLPGRTGVE